jgi:transposase
VFRSGSVAVIRGVSHELCSLHRCATKISVKKNLIARLQRMQFGRKSEKLAQQIEQLELRLEELQSEPVEHSTPEATPSALNNKDTTSTKPARHPVPGHLPRQTRRHEPKESACPDCGGVLRKLGEDVSEMLEYVPASFFVIRHVRPKLSCSHCERIVQAAAPSRPIERGMAGPGLLAHVLTSKYADHLSLCRQSARQGVELERSTLADWVGSTNQLLTPLVDALRHYVMAASKLHADDTPVPVLAPGNGKTKTGRLWTYVRDDRPAGGTAAPAVWFAYSPDRKGEHPERSSSRVPRNTAGRRLCGVQSALREWMHSRSGLLGPRSAQVLRFATGARFAPLCEMLAQRSKRVPSPGSECNLISTSEVCQELEKLAFQLLGNQFLMPPIHGIQKVLA